jgi:hypothetical protein
MYSLFDKNSSVAQVSIMFKHDKDAGFFEDRYFEENGWFFKKLQPSNPVWHTRYYFKSGHRSSATPTRYVDAPWGGQVIGDGQFWSQEEYKAAGRK